MPASSGINSLLDLIMRDPNAGGARTAPIGGGPVAAVGGGTAPMAGGSVAAFSGGGAPGAPVGMGPMAATGGGPSNAPDYQPTQSGESFSYDNPDTFARATQPAAGDPLGGWFSYGDLARRGLLPGRGLEGIQFGS